MRRHYAQTKAERQAEWLARFSDALLTREPALSGRIDWNAALHYFFSGAYGVSDTTASHLRIQRVHFLEERIQFRCVHDAPIARII